MTPRPADADRSETGRQRRSSTTKGTHETTNASNTTGTHDRTESRETAPDRRSETDATRDPTATRREPSSPTPADDTSADRYPTSRATQIQRLRGNRAVAQAATAARDGQERREAGPSDRDGPPADAAPRHAERDLDATPPTKRPAEQEPAAGATDDEASASSSSPAGQAPAAAADPAQSLRSPDLHRGPGPRLVRQLREMAVQPKLTVGQPNDQYEREADAVAAAVTSGGPAQAASAESATGSDGAAAGRPPPRSPAPVQSRPASGGSGTPQILAPVAETLRSPGAGRPVPGSVRRQVEPQLEASLDGVQVHDGPAAAHAAGSLGARALTRGKHIFLAGGESPHDVGLLAHEATHVVQQGAAGDSQSTTAPTADVQRFVPDVALEKLNEYANQIPGWTLLTVIIGYNPLTGADVERTPSNLVEGLLGLVPFGAAIIAKLREFGILQDAFSWVTGKLDDLDLTLARVKQTIEAAWEEARLLKGLEYNFDVLKRNFRNLYNDVVSFATSVADKVMEMIKGAARDLAERLLADNEAWSLIKKILGRDPLREEDVQATPTEILEDFLTLIGKEQHLQQMRKQGVVQETAQWLATQFERFMALLGRFRKLISQTWAALQPAALPNLRGNLASLARQVDSFLTRVWEFASTVAGKVIDLIKDALLGKLSAYATENLPGFTLLTVILGQNPFTGETVPRTPQTIMRGFITLLPGGAAIYQRLAQTDVIPKAGARIQTAVEQLGITWKFIKGLFVGIWERLSIEALVEPVNAFARILAQFRGPISRLLAFIKVVLRELLFVGLQLMNFPTQLVSSILSNAMQAVDAIKRDPIGFLLNMLRAVKLGFQNFFSNILTHLAGGVTDWLFRGLGDAGLQPPTDFTLQAVLDFVLEVTGITTDRLWAKLAERIGQEKVDRIRGAIDKLTGIWTFVRDVRERGIAAIWEYIEARITGLWDMIVEKARNWIIERVINRASQWLLSLLDPSGVMAVINSFKAFFNAVQSAVEYLRDILAIINDYVSTIAAVARGELAAGAQKLEQGLANAIPVAIGFLANQLGLGNIGGKIKEIVAGIRETVDRAIDWLLDKAESAVQSVMGALGMGTDEKAKEDAPDTGDAKHDTAVAAGLADLREMEQQYVENGVITQNDAETVAASVRREHPVFRKLEVVDGGDSWNYVWAASKGEEVDTPAEKAERGPRSSFEGRSVTESGIVEELRNAGYKKPYQIKGTWVVARKAKSSGLPKLSVVDGRITTEPEKEKPTKGEVTVDMQAIIASLPPHPYLEYFSVDPTSRVLRLQDSLRKEVISGFKPRSTKQMRREIEKLMNPAEDTAEPVEIPVGGMKELEEAERTGQVPRVSGTGLRATAMSQELIEWFVEVYNASDGWPPGWEVHHVVPLAWGGNDDVSNYAAIHTAIHKEISNWWYQEVRQTVLSQADAAAARRDGTTAEYRTIRF